MPLAYEYDDPKSSPLYDEETIGFNGIGDDGHETFLIHRTLSKEKPRYEGHDPNWSFCKTAHKPYDVVVTAVLAYLASTTTAFEVTSDGTPSEWTAGIDLAKRATGEEIKLPEQVTV